MNRIEPALNEWKPGQTQDTTSPRQAVANLAELTYGKTLKPWAEKVLLQAMRDAHIERKGQAPMFAGVYTNLDDPNGQFNDAFVAEAAEIALAALG